MKSGLKLSSESKQTAQLVEILRALECSYANLLGLLRVRKERVRRGDLKGLYDCAQDERRLLNEIRSMDGKREALMDDLSCGELYGVDLLDELVDQTTGPMRSELCSVRAQLRNRVEEVRHEYGVIRQVGEALSAHVALLVQRLNALGPNAVLYGRNGKMGGRQPLLSGVDLRT